MINELNFTPNFNALEILEGLEKGKLSFETALRAIRGEVNRNSNILRSAYCPQMELPILAPYL